MLEKSRNWSVIGWVESLPENIWKKLEETNLPIIVSPLHNKDIEEETGELKKPHYHIIFNFDGPVTLRSMQELCNDLGLSTYVERVRNLKNIIDYLTHHSRKSKEKYKYDVNDIHWINCDINDFINVSFKFIIQYIRENQIMSFYELVDKLIDDNENDLLEYVSKNSYYCNTYLSSLTNKKSETLKSDMQWLYNLLCQVDDLGKFSLDKKDYDRLYELFGEFDIEIEGM